MWLGPMFLRLDFERGSQMIGFIGALLLAIEAIGDERKKKLDEFLTQNTENIDKHLSALVSSFLLIRHRSQEIDPDYYGGDRREMFLVYMAAIIDLVLVLGFLKWGAPLWFQMSGKELLAVIGWKIHLIYLIPIVSSYFLIIAPPRVRKALWYPWTVLWAFSFLCFGWIILPWLAFVVLTYIVFKILVLILRVKRRVALGNLFVILGFLMVVYSFGVFVSINVQS